MIDLIKEHFWLILFFIWGLPLSYYRSNFRKIIYQTEDWKINFKPLFIKEIKGLFGNIYPGNLRYIKARDFYRLYLSIYTVLFLLYYFYN
ncbi:MAG: Uncharacterised protein [Flavobacterium sp. SCGC AAA160-P02]|nr:MAG: Uncharacterised protein [Flavobacterium sp. SCGC AAA160-P02]